MNLLVDSFTDLPTTTFSSTDAHHQVTHFTSFLASQLVSSLSANLSTESYLDEPLNFTYLTSENDFNYASSSPSGSPELTSSSNINLANPSYIEFRDRSRFWIQRILVPLVMIIGVIGNSMTIVIMTRRRMRSSTNFYLAALASIDMMYLIFIFILSLKHYPDADHSTFYYYWVFYPFSLMIVDGCSNISVWLTVTFTFERFIVVTHPIRGKVICTEARAKKVILAVFIICFTYVLPTPFEWIIVEKLSPIDNSTRIDVRYSDFGRNKTYKTIYYWTTSVLFTFLPLTLLAFFNAFLIRSVQLSRRARSEMTQSKITTAYSTVSKNDSDPSPRLGRNGVTSTGGTSSGSAKVDHSTAQETKITIMLISVVVLFLCCQSPTAIMLIYSSVREYGRNTNEYYLHIALNNIFNFLVAVNAAGNFVLYSLLSQKYRRTFVQLFCPCIKGRLSRLQSYQQTLYPSNATTIGYSTSSDKRFNELLSVSSDSKSRGASTSPRVSRVGLPGSNGFDFGGRPNNSNYNLNLTPTTPTANMNSFTSNKNCTNNNYETERNSTSDQNSTPVVEINVSTNEDKEIT